MSEISFNNTNMSIDHSIDFSDIIDNIRNNKKAAKKVLGLVGLNIVVPISCLIATYKLFRQKKDINTVLDAIWQKFEASDERTQMLLERDLLKLQGNLENTLTPLIGYLTNNKILFSDVFRRQAIANLNLVKSRIRLFTHTVYHERVDPATDPVLFNELSKAYNGFDLSDWKKEVGRELNCSNG